jgi:electron transfer flavoprotein beta subunit
VEILVCVKRVPMVGGRVVLTADGQDVDTRLSGFTVSPHEECAVEEAVQLVGREGGSVTVLTLGPPEAADQLRDMLALGAQHAVLLETDGREWGPIATAAAIAQVAARRVDDGEAPGGLPPSDLPPSDVPPSDVPPSDVPPSDVPPFDLLLFGNEAADTGDYQVGIRVAHLLGLLCVTGIKRLELTDGGLRASREYRGTQEAYDVTLPAVVGVKEGINLPRYPSLPGRLRAKRAKIEVRHPEWRPEGLRKEGLRLPAETRKRAQILGSGVDAVPALVALLDELGLLP